MMEPSAKRVCTWIGEFGPQLLGVARAFAQDADEAEDILQETWLVALRRQECVREDARVGAWLYRIVLNVGRARARKRSRRRALLGRWFHPDVSVGDDGAHPGGLDEDLSAVLWREISDLPPLQRTVLLHRVVDELSTSETAHAIERAEGTVKASLHRALKRLEARLRARGVDPSLLEGVRE